MLHHNNDKHIVYINTYRQ